MKGHSHEEVVQKLGRTTKYHVNRNYINTKIIGIKLGEEFQSLEFGVTCLLKNIAEEIGLLDVLKKTFSEWEKILSMAFYLVGSDNPIYRLGLSWVLDDYFSHTYRNEKNNLYKSFTIKELLDEMKDLKILKFKGELFLNPCTKRQGDLLRLFNIPMVEY
jgi:hypothetical protein